MENPQTQASVHREVRMQTVGYILTAFGLVVGLAWNEAITAFINTIIPLGKDSLGAKFIYAIVVTLLVILVSRYVQRLAAKE